MSLAAGDRLGRYEILGPIGAGGIMGATYHFMTLGLESSWILQSRSSRCDL